MELVSCMHHFPDKKFFSEHKKKEFLEGKTSYKGSKFLLVVFRLNVHCIIFVQYVNILCILNNTLHDNMYSMKKLLQATYIYIYFVIIFKSLYSVS
jgi:hypothetical protein